MELFSDIIINGDIGTLYICWGEDSLIKGVYYKTPPIDIFTQAGDIKKEFPAIYSFLKYFPNGSEISADMLDLKSCTKFYKDIYIALFNTKKSETLTYKELAAKAGYPNASRACGTAMKKNRFPLLIPCHRVVSHNGIGSYSMGGTDIKRKLLLLEGVTKYV